MSENPSIINSSPKPTGGLKKNISRFGNIEPFEAIIRISSRVTKSGPFIHQFINELYKFMDFSLVAFYQLEPDETLNLIEIETDLPQKASYLNNKISTKSDEPIAQTARLQEPRFLSNFEDEENKYLQGVFHPETISTLCLPVLINERLFGVVDLQVSAESKLTKSDLSYFNTIMKMFGIFLGDTLNKEKIDLPVEDLMKFFSATSSLFSAKTETQMKDSLTSAFENSGFVMGLFSMEKNELILRLINDPYGTSFDKTLIGLSTNYEKTIEKIQNKEALFLTDLPNQTEFGDFLSFFIRRECQSLAMVPVRLHNQVIEVIVMGSRSSTPINKDQVESYLEIINIYEKRLSYEQNLSLVKNQEALQELIEDCTQKIIGSDTADALVSNVAKEIVKAYEEDVDLYLTRNDSVGQKTTFNLVFQEGKKAEIDALPISNDLGKYLKSVDEPKLVSITDQEIALLHPVLKEKKPNSLIFLPISRDDSSQQVFIITAVGNREFSASDLSALKIISKMISNKLAQFNKDASLAKISSQTQKNLELQKKLSEISKSLSEYKTHGEVLAALPRLLNMAGLARRIATFVPLAEGGLRLVGSAGLTEKHFETITDTDSNIIQEAAKILAPILIDNYLLENKHPVSIDSLSGITLPLVFENNLFGVLNLEDTENSHFSAADFDLYQTLADNIGSVFSSINLVNQIQRQVAQQEQLYAATEKIRRSLDMESILKVSAEEIARLINAKETKIEVKLEEDQAPLDVNEGASE